MAMEEKENAPNIYDQVLHEVESHGKDSLTRTDVIFGLICDWLDKVFDEEGYEEDDYARKVITGRFSPYMVRK